MPFGTFDATRYLNGNPMLVLGRVGKDRPDFCGAWNFGGGSCFPPSVKRAVGRTSGVWGAMRSRKRGGEGEPKHM